MPHTSICFSCSSKFSVPSVAFSHGPLRVFKEGETKRGGLGSYRER
jgi:hypothetical protein